jgi:hypothetical protein
MSQFERKILYPYVPDMEPSLEEENRQLKDENKRLKARLNTQLTKDITVLPAIKAVECPAASKIVPIAQCKGCDYFQNRIILTTMDGQGLENVYCAYRDKWNLIESTNWKSEVQGEFVTGKEGEEK